MTQQYTPSIKYTKFELIKENPNFKGKVEDGMTLEDIYVIYTEDLEIFYEILKYSDAFDALEGIVNISCLFEIYGKHINGGMIEIKMEEFELDNISTYDTLYANRSIVYLYHRFYKANRFGPASYCYVYILRPWNEMLVYQKLYKSDINKMDPHKIDLDIIFKFGKVHKKWYKRYIKYVDSSLTELIRDMWKNSYPVDILDDFEMKVFKSFILAFFEDFQYVKLYRFVVKNDHLFSNEFIKTCHFFANCKMDFVTLSYDLILSTDNDLINCYETGNNVPRWSIFYRNNINTQPNEIKIILKNLKEEASHRFPEINKMDLYIPSQTDGFESFWITDLNLIYK